MNNHSFTIIQNTWVWLLSPLSHWYQHEGSLPKGSIMSTETDTKFIKTHLTQFKTYLVSWLNQEIVCQRLFFLNCVRHFFFLNGNLLIGILCHISYINLTYILVCLLDMDKGFPFLVTWFVRCPDRLYCPNLKCWINSFKHFFKLLNLTQMYKAALEDGSWP